MTLIRYALASFACVLGSQIIVLGAQYLIPFNEFTRGVITVLMSLFAMDVFNIRAPWRDRPYVASLEDYESEGDARSWKGPIA
jgi:hypothetical protein